MSRVFVSLSACLGIAGVQFQSSQSDDSVLQTLKDKVIEYKVALKKKLDESNEQLTVSTCLAFAKQGAQRIDQVQEMTIDIEDMLEFLKAESTLFASLKVNANKDQLAAIEAEKAIVSSSPPLEQIKALRAATTSGQGVDSQSWTNLIAAVDKLQEENKSVLLANVNEAQSVRQTTITDIKSIFAVDSNFPCSTPQDSATTAPASPSKADESGRLSQKLKTTSDQAADMLQHAGHMFQAEDEQQLESELLKRLTTLQTHLDSQARRTLTAAFKDVADALDAAFAEPKTPLAPSEEFKMQRSKLVTARSLLEKMVADASVEDEQLTVDAVQKMQTELKTMTQLLPLMRLTNTLA